MVCNDLVMPVLLRMRSMRLAERQNLTGLLLGIRRGAIVAVVLLGYFYFRLAGEAYALVAIGLISFAAVAQFAPAVIGGIYWKGGTRAGALAGLCAGFGVWLLHAAAAVVRQVGLAADRLPGGRAVRHRAAQALRAVRPRRAERHHARDAVEHGRQHRRLCRWSPLLDAAERGRAGAGRALRRRVPAAGRGARRARLEGHGVAAGPAGAARAVPRRRARRRGVRRIRAAARRTRPRPAMPADAGARAVRRNRARGRHRRRLGADHGGLHRQRGRRCRSRKCARCWTRRRRSSRTATS